MWLPLLVVAFALQISGTLGEPFKKPDFINEDEVQRKLSDIEETLPAGTSIVQVKAEEGKLDITYSISDTTYFYIDENTGVIFLSASWDYEADKKKRTLSLRITAEDEEGDKEEITVEVRLRNMNDNKPKFSDTAPSIFLIEDVPINTLVTELNVIDLDEDQNPVTLKVKCINNEINSLDRTCEVFELVKKSASNKHWSGKIQTKSRLDYEKNSSYSITLSASDSKFTTTQDFPIKIKDVNDSPPLFKKTPSPTIPEGKPVGTFIVAVSAEDTDLTEKRPIRYELIGDAVAVTHFDISKENGSITNKVILDYEGSVNPFTLEIKASELLNITTGELGNNSETTTVTTIKITLTDVNDNCPTFRESSLSVDVMENASRNHTVTTLFVTDEDKTEKNRMFAVSLTGGNGIFKLEDRLTDLVSSFSIEVNNSEQLDFETSPDKTYELIITAKDKGLNSCSNSIMVTVVLKDINDVRPTFTKKKYTAKVKEDAPAGLSVTTIKASDQDTGVFGKDGFIFSLKHAEQIKLFNIDPVTGEVTVANCLTPGNAPCLDHENRRRHYLTVFVEDNKGNNPSFTNSVSLDIDVENVNEYTPLFDGDYTGSVEEGNVKPIPVIAVKAKDGDRDDSITYSLVPSRDANFWMVNPKTGHIEAKNPIYLNNTQNNREWFFFQVQASDGEKIGYTTVNISVIDKNDNQPTFMANRTVTIMENTTGDICFTNMTATDGDSPTSNNGRLLISIDDGSLGKFVARPTKRREDRFVAEICTVPNVIFSFKKKNEYILTLKVRDQGIEAKTGTATLTVKIQDINNETPYFELPVYSESVAENKPPGFTVTQVIAKDDDFDNKLIISFSPIEALDSTGANVTDPALYQDLFSITENGIVQVNRKLDRDIVSFVDFKLVVVDMNASPPQTGTGALRIHILEYNDQQPNFDEEIYEFNVKEERSIGFFVDHLVARDEDDQISLYQLIENPENLFKIDADSGILRVNGRLDYEARHNVTLKAVAWDNGNPQLSGTTDIFINIINLNDNAPEFKKYDYQLNLPEHSQQTGAVLTVSASDKDEGDFGVVRYMTNDSFFSVDQITGEIFLKSEADLDRENSPNYFFIVTAIDSPLNATVRLSTTMEVTVNLGDINDNCPQFSPNNKYNGNIIETADIGDQVLKLLASDDDDGDNGTIKFSIDSTSVQPSDAQNLFSIMPGSGRIEVNGNLRNKSGIYSFMVVASDQNGENITGDMCSTRVKVIIEIQKATNDAPRWVLPPIRNFIINVLEEQYLGMLVYKCKAEDPNSGKEGQVDYFFNVKQSLQSTTGEFSINQVTGVIIARMVFDREQVSSYVLTLVAKDQGNPASSSETVLIVNVLDVNDNEPQFSMRNGQTISLNFFIREGETPDIIGFVSATDKDSDHKNNKVFYRIVAGNNEGLFDLERETGALRLSSKASNGLDREAKGTYDMDILAYNDVTDDTVIRYRRKRSTNPSLVTVFVTVLDVNDTPPKFSSTDFHGCVPKNAPFGQSILRVQAQDQDLARTRVMTYSKIKESTNGFFAVDSTKGTIRNVKLLYDIDSPVSKLRIRVNDDGDQGNIAETDVMVFVTSADSEVMLVVSQPSADVRLYKDQLIRSLINTSFPNPINYVCIREIRDHIGDDGTYSYSTSDVFLSAVKVQDDDYTIYRGSDLQRILHGRLPQYQSLHVKAVEMNEMESDDDKLSLTEDPVLAIFIIAILLIFLALILLCLACCFIRSSKKKKMKKLRAEEHRPVEVAKQQPAPEMGTNVNPMYDNKGFEEGNEYAVVQKKRPSPERVAPPIVPVMVPAMESEPAPDVHVSESEPVIITEPIMADEQPEMQPPPDDFFVQEPDVEMTFPTEEPVIEIETFPADEPEPVIDTVIETEVLPDDDYHIPEAPTEEEIDVEFGDLGDSPSPPHSPSPPPTAEEGVYRIETNFL